MQCSGGFQHRMLSFVISCYYQHTECFPTKLFLVLRSSMCTKIHAHFPLNACLVNIGACDRHRAAINLDHEAPARAVGEFQSEYQIGNDSDLADASLVGELGPKQKRITGAPSDLRCCSEDVGGMEELKIIPFSDSAL